MSRRHKLKLSKKKMQQKIKVNLIPRNQEYETYFLKKKRI